LDLGAIAIIVVGVVGLLIAYFGNQLPPVSQFPGRNWLIVRLLLWLLGLLVVAQVLASQAVSDEGAIALWCLGVAALTAMIFDGFKLVAVLWRIEALSNIGSDLSRSGSVRDQLLAEARRQVRRRLDYAFGEQALINVSMQSQPDAVAGHPYQSPVFLVPQPRQTVKTFADSRLRAVESEETILDTFEREDIAGQLLILGALGAGKTTALLKLAESLLDRAEGSNEIPYIFELSAWRDDKQELASWLIAQLKLEQGIDEKVSREWLVNGQLLPLLDGLDELAPARQPSCIAKINEFMTSQLGRQVVVCCRTKAYEACEEKGVRLNSLKGALRLEPLSEGKIRAYFEAIERPDIWQALQVEEGLGALLRPPELDSEETALLKIPLFLQMLTVAYQDGQAIASKSDLFDAYIEQRLATEAREQDRRLARKKEIKKKWAFAQIKDELNIERTKQYLVWLARKLKENNISNNFSIEQMQPNWLEKKAQKWQYHLILDLIYGSIVGLMFGLIIGLINTLHIGTTLVGGLIFGLIYGLIVGLIFGLVCGLIFGLIGNFEGVIQPIKTFRISFSHTARKRLLENLISGLISGLIGGLISGLIGGLLGGLIGGLIFGLISGWISSLLGGFILGLQSGLAGVIITLIISLTVSLVVGLMFGLIASLLDVLQKPFKIQETPNQGITDSAKNMLMVTVISYFVSMAIFLLWSFIKDEITLQENLAFSIPIALFIGYHFGGGIPVIQHITLRFLLHRQGHIPHNYAQFLRYTTERRLTQQIGGRFRFLHRELLDHFAAMPSDDSQIPSSR
jgi:hypothetical protein